MRNVVVVAAASAGILLAIAALQGCPSPTAGCVVDSDCKSGETCHQGACVAGAGEGEGEGVAGEGEGAVGEGEGAAGEGEGAAGEGEGEGAAGEGEGEGEGEGAPFVGTTIADIYAAPGGGLDVTLTGVVVTNVIPAVPGDPAGFFLQDVSNGSAGPAVFVTDATALAGVAIGDVVDAHATAKVIVGGQTQVSALTVTLPATSTGFDLTTIRQDESGDANIVTNLAGLESELIHVDGTISGGALNGGGGPTGHNNFAIATAGFAAPDSTKLVLRLPVDVVTALGAALGDGCAFSIDGNMWRGNAKAEVSIWDAGAFTSHGCPASHLTSAAEVNATTVTATFSAPLDGTTLLANGSQFAITGDATIAVSAASLSANGKVVTLTTATIANGNYTLAVDATLKDANQNDVPAGTATFSVGGPTADLSGLVLSQTNASHSFTLPANTLVPVNGFLIVARNHTQAEFETFYGVTLPGNTVFIDVGGATQFPVFNGNGGGQTVTLAHPGPGAIVDGPTIALSGSNKDFKRTNPAGLASDGTSWTIASGIGSPGTTPTGGTHGGCFIAEAQTQPGTGNADFEYVEIFCDAATP